MKSDLCPTCHGRRRIIPMGYQGEPVDCPTCSPTCFRKAAHQIAVTANAGDGMNGGRCGIDEDEAMIIIADAYKAVVEGAIDQLTVAFAADKTSLRDTIAKLLEQH